MGIPDGSCRTRRHGSSGVGVHHAVPDRAGVGVAPDVAHALQDRRARVVRPGRAVVAVLDAHPIGVTMGKSHVNGFVASSQEEGVVNIMLSSQ